MYKNVMHWELDEDWGYGDEVIDRGNYEEDGTNYEDDIMKYLSGNGNYEEDAEDYIDYDHVDDNLIIN